MKKLLAQIKAYPYTKYILLGLVLATIPSLVYFDVLKSSYVTLVGVVMIYTIVSLGLNLLLGWSGLISLGTAGFMGLAAYISAYMTINLKMPFEVTLIVSILIPVAISVLVGLISLRIEGLYLAIATLAVSEIFRKTFAEFEFITNGFSGKSVRYPTFFGFFKLDTTMTYLLLVVFMVVIMILIHNLINSHVGRALNAMRGSEAAAQAMGINLLKYRLLAFALATALTSTAGILYAHFIKYVEPSKWNLGLSLNILAVIIIGGVRSIIGTFVGSLVVFAVPDLVLKQIPYFGKIPNFAYIINGILIIVVILYYPAGLIRVFNDGKDAVVKLFKKSRGKTV